MVKNKKNKEKQRNKVGIKELKVLLLDDEQKWHDAIEKELNSYAKEKGLKFDLLHAYNPDEALSIYEKEKPDLIISDVSITDVGHRSDKDGIYKFVKPLREEYNYKGNIIL